MKARERDVVETLNRECDCAVIDLDRLRRRMDDALDLSQPILESHPHLFSDLPVFLSSAHMAAMQRVIEAVEATVQLPKYRDAVLARAPAIARHDTGVAGVFMGFDFHISPDGPKLIEINTNAGGAFLNIAAHEAQRACCRAAEDYLAAQPGAEQLEREIASMFQREWALARRARPLRTIAIVDDDPRGQFLYPEFVLARKLFDSHGIRAYIADPSDFESTDDGLQLQGERIDLVYNRLTDFYFEAPRSRVLRLACERDLAVITPHPRAHALYADKRNLSLLGDAAFLTSANAPGDSIETLVDGIPETRAVAGGAETWWRDRKAWFFKPHGGFGSRGTYRGDKLTRRVFTEVIGGGYMAQAVTPPGERWRSSSSRKEIFKADIRCYVYSGRIQLMAARLYQGQTTNFRTAGGGFAPVYVIGDCRSGGLEVEACG